jgi:hypothetical protein
LIRESKVSEHLAIPAPPLPNDTLKTEALREQVHRGRFFTKNMGIGPHPKLRHLEKTSPKSKDQQERTRAYPNYSRTKPYYTKRTLHPKVR